MAAALLAVGVFVTLPKPIEPFWLLIVLEVVLLLVLLVRGRGARRVSFVTIVALILTTFLLLTALGVLNVPGLN